MSPTETLAPHFRHPGAARIDNDLADVGLLAPTFLAGHTLPGSHRFYQRRLDSVFGILSTPRHRVCGSHQSRPRRLSELFKTNGLLESGRLNCSGLAGPGCTHLVSSPQVFPTQAYHHVVPLKVQRPWGGLAMRPGPLAFRPWWTNR